MQVLKRMKHYPFSGSSFTQSEVAGVYEEFFSSKTTFVVNEENMVICRDKVDENYT